MGRRMVREWLHLSDWIRLKNSSLNSETTWREKAYKNMGKPRDVISKGNWVWLYDYVRRTQLGAKLRKLWRGLFIF